MIKIYKVLIAIGFAIVLFIVITNHLSRGIIITDATDAAKCMNNLIRIENAKTRWAQDGQKTTNDTPTWSDLIGTNGYLSVYPKCNRGGVYDIGEVGTPPKCSVHGIFRSDK